MESTSITSNVTPGTEEVKEEKTTAEGDSASISPSETVKEETKDADVPAGSPTVGQKRSLDTEEEDEDSKKKRRKGMS